MSFTRPVAALVAALVQPAGFAAAQTCVPPPPGVVAWWTLDETTGTVAADQAGGHPGAYAGTPAPADGEVRGALEFAANGYVAVPDSDAWAFGARDFSIELWARFATSGGGTVSHPGDILIGNDEGPGTRNKWFFALGGGYLNFHVNGPAVGGRFFPLVPFTPTPGRWYHLAITRSGSRYTVYVDGAPQGTATEPSAIPDASAPLTLGMAEQLGYLRGRLDEVTIYGRALSPDEVGAIAAAGRAGKCVGFAVHPDRGGDTGAVTLRIDGSGLATGAAVRLTRDGQPDLVASAVSVAQDGRSLTATVDLTGAARGPWSVVIDGPDASATALAGAFTVEPGEPADVWASILGLPVFRPGRAQAFNVLFGAEGNTDLDEVLLWVTGIPDQATVVASPSARPLPDPTLDGTQAPLTRTVRGAPVVAVLQEPLAASDTGNLALTLTMPEFAPQELAVWSYVRDRSVIRAPASPASTCQAIGCMPPEDREALKRAAQVAFAHSCAPFIFICYGGNLCRGAADDLAAALAAEVAQPGSKLAGWGITRVLGCWSSVSGWWTHSSTMLTSPGGNQYLVDNTIFGYQLCQMTTARTNVWQTPHCQFHSGCTWVPDDLSPIQCKLPRPRQTHPIDPISSFDPNAKVGAAGAGDSRWLSGSEPLRYAIFFENLETATAPAQEVTIRDALSPEALDLGTLALGPIQLGRRHVVPPSGVCGHVAEVDLRPEASLLVRVEASLDPNSGALVWRLRSVDPATGNPPQDPTVGFLPPNVSPPQGSGSVSFTVMPRADLPTGATIRNRASIVFDQNDPIETAEWSNVVDRTKPVSQVAPLPDAQDASPFTVQWSGTDEGSGIRDYTIYVSVDGGEPSAWLTDTTELSAAFPGEAGKRYAFHSVARDLAGNVEDAPRAADAATSVVTRSGSASCKGCGAGGSGLALLGLAALWPLRRRARRRAPRPETADA